MWILLRQPFIRYQGPMLTLLLACAAKDPAAEMTSPAGLQPLPVLPPLQAPMGELVGEGEPIHIPFAWPQQGTFVVEERLERSHRSGGQDAQELSLAASYTVQLSALEGDRTLLDPTPGEVIEARGDRFGLGAVLLANPVSWVVDGGGNYLGTYEPESARAQLEVAAQVVLQELQAQQGPELAQQVGATMGPALELAVQGVVARNRWAGGMGLVLGRDYVVGQEQTQAFETVLPTRAEPMPSVAKIRVLGERDCGGAPCIAIAIATEQDPEGFKQALADTVQSQAAVRGQTELPVVSQASARTTRSLLILSDSGLPYSEALISEVNARIHQGEVVDDIQTLEIHTRQWVRVPDASEAGD